MGDGVVGGWWGNFVVDLKIKLKEKIYERCCLFFLMVVTDKYTQSSFSIKD